MDKQSHVCLPDKFPSKNGGTKEKDIDSMDQRLHDFHSVNKTQIQKNGGVKENDIEPMDLLYSGVNVLKNGGTGRGESIEKTTNLPSPWALIRSGTKTESSTETEENLLLSTGTARSGIGMGGFIEIEGLPLFAKMEVRSGTEKENSIERMARLL